MDSVPGFSKYDMIYCSINLWIPRSAVIAGLYRNINGNNLGQLLADAASID
jgi:hypothetical protein